ncbi:MAG: hypothetical protein GF307_07000 [candidate division Zixibacteria bacterium]|nr:hypothetical protein [candidate division Zixibacteria bacterium]
MARLSVNIDDIAYLRGGDENGTPNLYHAAMQVEMAGADGIAICPARGDGSISRKEFQVLKNVIGTHFNMIIPPTEFMIDTAVSISPGSVTLIGEGDMDSRIMPALDLALDYDRISELTTELQTKDIMVSLYIPPEVEGVKLAAKTKADYVEFSTWGYVNASGGAERAAEAEKIISMAQLANKLLLGVSCGGGLDKRNIKALADSGQIEEFVIGRGITGRALFTGLENAINEIAAIIKD